MGTLQPESENKGDLEDSGYVQDGGPDQSGSPMENGYYGQAQLLDLSDDVLLYILKHCSPHDLKALGFTCLRLGSLVQDRTLWQVVDARDLPSGRARLRWFLTHMLHHGTRQLLLSGYAREARGCLGHVNRTRKEVEAVKPEGQTNNNNGETAADNNQENNVNQNGAAASPEPPELPELPELPEMPELPEFPEPPYPLARARARLHVNPQQLFAEVFPAPLWPEENPDIEYPPETEPENCVLADGSCPGPQFTLTQSMLRRLSVQCCNLSALSLEYCNINCRTTGLNLFPPRLKKLSLRGTKCYNLPLDKSFLFKIQDYLPLLEHLDVSECEWLEPASLLPLSKMSALKHLVMQHCYRMSEFVAYASLATRYGFRHLRVLDLRGSPVGDSEVSALGWIPYLEELYLSPAPPIPPWPKEHSHYKGDALPPHMELEDWELEQEPDYFKDKPTLEETSESSTNTSIEELENNLEQLRQIRDQLSCDNDHIRVDFQPQLDQEPQPENSENHRQPHENGSGDHSGVNPEPGPSRKRKKNNGDPDMAACGEGKRIKEETNQALKEAQNKRKRQAEEQKKLELQRQEASTSSSYDRRSTLRKRSKTVDEDPRTSNDKSDSYPNTRSRSPKKKFKADEDSSPDKSKRKSKDQDSDDDKKGKSLRRRSRSDDDKAKRKPKDSSDSSSSDDDDDVNRRRGQVNEGASTSRSDQAYIIISRNRQLQNSLRAERDILNENGDRNQRNGNAGPSNQFHQFSNRNEFEDYIRFRQNRQPEMVRRPARREEPQQDAESRHHILYVNVGQQLHAVYRLLPSRSRPIFPSIRTRPRQNLRNIFYSPPTPHLDATSLVTDSAIRRFGRSDDDVYVHIERNIPIGHRESGSRPNRSNLRILSITGFRLITDRSLVHLATAAPSLRRIDFTETGVTDSGVESFRSLRPDCEVRHSPYVEKDDENNEGQN